MTRELKLSKQELEIAMAACCVGTMWDEYEGTEDFDHMVRLRLNHLIELVRKSQPSLPSDLDEAAEEFGKRQGIELAPFAKKFFKRGAEWMAGQGDTFETIMQEDDVDELVPTCPDMYNHGYSCGDKVIVQIRKKQ